MHARNTGGALAAAAVLGCAVAVWNYLRAGTGVDHTAGALLVAVTTAVLIAVAAAVAVAGRAPRWLRAVLIAICLLDIAGTGLAAWFLHEWALLALMVLAAAAWVLALFAPAAGRRVAA
jgi:hypothetical protein